MSEAILQLKTITKSFPSPDGRTIEVLKGTDLILARGESASLRGESGSGKTTFLNIAACLETPTSGEVFWNGARVDNHRNARQAKLRAKYMGFVFQAYCLVPELNAFENVMFAARIAGTYSSSAVKRAKEILERVGLTERIKHMPYQLSGGECQRVAIARAIINSPSIILADEPTGNLDEATGEEVMEMFLKLCKDEKTALLLVTHNSDFAKRTSRRLTLSQGVIHE